MSIEFDPKHVFVRSMDDRGEFTQYRRSGAWVLREQK